MNPTPFTTRRAPVCAIVAALLAAPATAQSWVTTLGGSGFDSVVEVVTGSGGDFLAAGNTYSFDPAGDGWVARVKDNGVVAWEVILGAAGADSIESMVATPDGGIAFAGTTASLGSGGWVAKLSPTGALEWQRTYKGTQSLNAIALSPNGYYLAGAVDQDGIYRDACAVEIDFTGNVLWQKRLGGDLEDVASSLAPTADGVLIGIQANSGFPGAPKIDPVPFTRPWLVKLDVDGNEVWQKVYNMSGGDVWNDITALPDGSYVATGEILAMAFFQGDAWTVRLDANGNVLWDTRAGDSFGLAVDKGVQVVPTQGGGFAVAGSTATAGAGSEDLWLLGYDSSGTLVWDEVIGSTGFDNGLALVEAVGGDLIVGGFLQGLTGPSTDAALMRVSSEGQLETNCQLSGTTNPNIWSNVLEIEVPKVQPTDLNLVMTSPAAQVVGADTGAFACPPVAAVTSLGCGINPAGSLTISAQPVLGTTVTFGVDNPLGTQSVGSIPLLSLSLAADPAGPPCGTPLPGFGMSGPGAVGELLVGLPPILTLVGAPWAGPGSPAPLPLPLPADPALLGLSLFTQGALFDPVGAVTIGLTVGLELQLGA